MYFYEIMCCFQFSVHYCGQFYFHDITPYLLVHVFSVLARFLCVKDFLSDEFYCALYLGVRKYICKVSL